MEDVITDYMRQGIKLAWFDDSIGAYRPITAVGEHEDEPVVWFDDGKCAAVYNVDRSSIVILNTAQIFT